MPQKKNPDVAELIRGRSARSTGALMSLLTLVKALPMSYNRDLQEDKESVFRAHENVVACLRMMSGMLSDAKFRPERMNAMLKGGFLNATDLADYLVRKGMPFRQSHEVVGRMVRHCIEKGIGLEDMPLQEMASFSNLIGPDIREHIALDRCVSRRMSFGGTSPTQVDNQIEIAKANVSIQSSYCERERKRLLETWNTLIYKG
jgi:argininosuccinate lyase